jgi:hypothetical protein
MPPQLGLAATDVYQCHVDRFSSKFEATEIWKPRYYYYNERTKPGYYDRVYMK